MAFLRLRFVSTLLRWRNLRKAYLPTRPQIASDQESKNKAQHLIYKLFALLYKAYSLILCSTKFFNKQADKEIPALLWVLRGYPARLRAG